MNRLLFSAYATAVGCAFALQCPATAIARTKEIVLHSFASGTDGRNPYASLIDVKGNLYGTTDGGGSSSDGTVFSVDPITGAETVLHTFSGGTDGAAPWSGVSLIDVNGTLYGTTTLGGANNEGTVFAVNRKSGAESVLHSFGTSPDGFTPLAGLVNVNGTLYGTTIEGGAQCGKHGGCGTVFSVNPTTRAESVVYSFCVEKGCTDGQNPVGGLIDVGGTLYGTTEIGGAYSKGTVFSVNPTSGDETVVYSFCGQANCADGSSPQASPINVNGTLYGTTGNGGAGGYGTVYSLDPTTGAETVLHSFGGQPDGAYVESGLIDVKGTLYGTTYSGGANCTDTGGCGTVFSVNPATGAETVVYSFCSQANCADGGTPFAGLIDVKGTLYGATGAGGTSTNCSPQIGCGTVFAIKRP